MRKILSGRRSKAVGDFIFTISYSSAQPFIIPLPSGTPTGGGVMGFTVDWGDGTTPLVVNSANHGSAQHSYGGVSGNYTVRISGPVRGWSFGANAAAYSASAQMMTRIQQWGDFRFTNTRAFEGCQNMGSITATDVPWFEEIDMTGCFKDCTKMSTITQLNDWNVYGVEVMESFFDGCAALNFVAGSGTPNLVNWDVKAVKSMRLMFNGATTWNGRMFKVQSTTSNLRGMFQFATSFNNNGNSDIGNWDVSKATDMGFMFSAAKDFNQNISSWSTTQVTDMQSMFAGNGGVAMAFNQPIGSWSTSNVTNMSGIFTRCDSFDQNLSNWNLNSISSYNNVFPILTQAVGSFGLSTSNYDALLVAWDTYSYPSLPANSTFNFGSSQYSLGSSAATARANLIVKWGGISDGGGV
jgi:hypothetical protein